MFSGKTTALIDRVNRYVSVQSRRNKCRKTLIINFIEDDRSDDILSPHSGKSISCDNEYIDCRKISKLGTLSEEYISKFDYIAIDECQFFDDITLIEKWLNNNVHIHCSGLIADSEKRPFGKMVSVFHLADTIEQLKAFCIYCGEKQLNAPFTKSIESTSLQKKIGGSNESVPVCGKHFICIN